MGCFLVDESLPESLTERLLRSGHEAYHVRTLGFAGAPDDLVFGRAQAQALGAVLITPDMEFGDIRRYPPGSHAGILVVRMPRVAAPTMVEELVRLVDEAGPAEIGGSIAIAELGHIRIRKGT